VKIRVAIVSTVFAILTASAAHAQGVPGGAAHGFYEGNRRAGPVGAVVGGAVGGVIGGFEGVLGINHSHDSYNEYAERRRRGSIATSATCGIRATCARTAHRCGARIFVSA